MLNAVLFVEGALQMDWPAILNLFSLKRKTSIRNPSQLDLFYYARRVRVTERFDGMTVLLQDSMSVHIVSPCKLESENEIRERIIRQARDNLTERQLCKDPSCIDVMVCGD
ncbi:hypothetical protein HY620_01500 [Candidatus Uhrbacteria bacterium]|nr:hypothetical protein [Candidatus Uhrbacteria bacterium]